MSGWEVGVTEKGKQMDWGKSWMGCAEEFGIAQLKGRDISTFDPNTDWYTNSELWMDW